MDKSDSKCPRSIIEPHERTYRRHSERVSVHKLISMVVTLLYSVRCAMASLSSLLNWPMAKTKSISGSRPWWFPDSCSIFGPAVWKYQDYSLFVCRRVATKLWHLSEWVNVSTLMRMMVRYVVKQELVQWGLIRSYPRRPKIYPQCTS